MPISTGISTKGGKRLEAIMKRAEQPRRSKVTVGIFPGSKYPDGTPVALVGALHEFGLGPRLPERPWFRQSIAELERDLPNKLKDILDPQTLTISTIEATRIGEYAKSVIQGRIADLQEPPNAPSTILLKGSDSPLQDTGQLHDAVDYETS